MVGYDGMKWAANRDRVGVHWVYLGRKMVAWDNLSVLSRTTPNMTMSYNVSDGRRSGVGGGRGEEVGPGLVWSRVVPNNRVA